MGALCICSFVLFLRFSWPFILDWMKTENFIPVICVARKGNRRTVATNVKQEDILKTFKKIDKLGFFDKLLYKVKPVTHLDLIQNKRAVNELSFEREFLEKNEQIFWNNFIDAGKTGISERTFSKIKPRDTLRRSKMKEAGSGTDDLNLVPLKYVATRK